GFRRPRRTRLSRRDQPPSKGDPRLGPGEGHGHLARVLRAREGVAADGPPRSFGAGPERIPGASRVEKGCDLPGRNGREGRGRGCRLLRDRRLVDSVTSESWGVRPNSEAESGLWPNRLYGFNG